MINPDTLKTKLARTERRCARCGKTLPSSEFYNPFTAYCKPCSCSYQREYCQRRNELVKQIEAKKQTL